MKFNQLLVLTLLLFSIFACEQDDFDDPIDIGEDVTFGIRHDRGLAEYEAAAQNTGGPNFNAVAAFVYTIGNNSDDEFVASGTLVAPNWILTAGHNFFVAEEQSEPARPGAIDVFFGNDPNNPSQTFEVEELVFHPTWITDNEDFIKGNDLCLVKLKSSVNNINPVPMFDSNAEGLDSKVWFCGFGDYSLLSGQDPNLFSKKHAIENILDRKIDGITTSINGTTYNGGLLAFDFDHPDAIINALGDNLVNADENLLGPGDSDAMPLGLEGTTVQGDSGGPLFVQDGNSWKLAGVLSGGASDPIPNHEDSSYGDISIFIRVSTHINWIRSVIQ